MLQSELTRIFRSTKGRIGILLIFLLPLIDFIQHIYDDIILFGGFIAINHPVYTSFLSGSSMGHFTQVLLFWILPIYFLLIYSDTYIVDRNCGFLKCLISRTGRRKYYKTKFKIAFLIPTIVMFASLILNFIMCCILFHSGRDFGGLESFYDTMDSWFIFGYNHPYIYYFIYILTASLVSGLCSVLGLCCSILFRNYFIAYPTAFFIWFLQSILRFGVGNSIQPYTEYGIGYYFSGFLIFTTSVLIVFIITYIVRLKKDEV